MPVVRFTRNLDRHVHCPDTEVSAGTVGAALDAVFALHPALRSYVLDDQGAVRHHVVVFVDGQPIRDRQRQGDLVGPRSTIDVLQALSGG